MKSRRNRRYRGRAQAFHGNAEVNRRDLLLCLEEGIPPAVAAELCGFSSRGVTLTASAPSRTEPSAATPAPCESPAGPGRCLPLPAVTGATAPKNFEDSLPERYEPFSEAELRATGGPPPVEPLMPLSRLWPYLHQVLGHRRPGQRLDARRAVAAAARSLPLHDLPRRSVLRWSTEARVLIDRTLPPGFLNADFETLCGELEALRGKTGLQVDRVGGPAVSGQGESMRSGQEQPPGTPAELICGLPVPAVPTLVVSDLGQLRGDRALMDAWREFGQRLQAAGMTPVALVPCPRDRWDADLSALWRCAYWDRHAHLPLGAQGMEALSDPDAIEKAAYRAECVLTLLAPAFLVEPALLRAVRCLLPSADADVGSEYDVRIGGALAVAGHDMSPLPQTRKARTDAFRAEDDVRKARVAEIVIGSHKNYGPQLRFDEIESLHDFKAPVSEELLEQVAEAQARTRATMLRDRGVPEAIRRHGLYSHERWELARRSREALGEKHAAYSWAFLCHYDGLKDAKLPEGMKSEHVAEAMNWVLTDPGRVSTWRVQLTPRVLQLYPYEPGKVELRAVFHLRRPHVEACAWRGEREESHLLVVEPDKPCRLPLGAYDRILLRSDCGTLDLPLREPPPWARCYAWDQCGLYAAFALGETVFRMRWIPPGTFVMGSPEDEPGRRDAEGPQHQVTIGRGFWMGETPVTQEQYRAVTGESPSHFQNAGPKAPVEQVSWDDTQVFCRRLAEALGDDMEPGSAFRLPSEAEWEYACRAGTETALYTGPITIEGANHAPELDAIAWYGGNSGDVDYEGGHDSSGWPEKQHSHTKAGTHPVAEKDANAFGLYDMIGNVWEWCEDEWHDSYKGAPDDGRAWEDDKARKGAFRVVRGGCWLDYARLCRSAFRLRYEPDSRWFNFGFRLVLARSSTADSLEQAEGRRYGSAASAERGPAGSGMQRTGQQARRHGGAGGSPPAGDTGGG